MPDRVGLSELARAPELARELEPQELARVMAEVATVSAAVASRLAESVPHTEPEPVLEAAGNWLTPDEAAAILGISRHSVYDRSRSKAWAKFAHRVSRKCLRLEESGLRRWMAAQAAARRE